MLYTFVHSLGTYAFSLIIHAWPGSPHFNFPRLYICIFDIFMYVELVNISSLHIFVLFVALYSGGKNVTIVCGERQARNKVGKKSAK
jgi:hypothetical protein